LTAAHIYAKDEPVPREKQFPIRIVLPLSREMAAGLDAAKADGEDRVSLIRQAIEAELKRRARKR
jgi:hypothetical protein